MKTCATPEVTKPTEKKCGPVCSDPLHASYVMDCKARIIEHVLIHGREQMDDGVLGALALLIDEVQCELGNLTDYCEQVDGLVNPLFKSLNEMYPGSNNFLGALGAYDNDKKIQRRFIADLHEAKHKSPFQEDSK